MLILAEGASVVLSTSTRRNGAVRRSDLLTAALLAVAAGLLQAACSPLLALLLSDGNADFGRLVQQAALWTAPGGAGLVVIAAAAGALNGNGHYHRAVLLTLTWSSLALATLWIPHSAWLAVWGGWSASICCVAAAALWVLLRIRYSSDRTKKIPHPEEAAERPSRGMHRACPSPI